jgi:hypothetical protein
MSQNKLDALLKSCGWRPWGKSQKRRRGGPYRCYRRGNKYLWRGIRYLERSDDSTGVDFETQTTAYVWHFVERA